MKRKRIFKIGICVLMVILSGGVQSLHAQKASFSDLDYPYEVKYQEIVNGQQIAYIDEGEGTPIVLIHGLGSYIPAWKQNIPALSKRYRVIALDLPGYGKSSKDAEAYSISFFAQTIVQLQDSLNISQAAWIGHSMGAQIALKAALMFPQKISKLVLIAPAGFETFTKQEGMLLSNFVTPASVEATPVPMIKKVFKMTFFEFPPEAQFMVEDRIAIRGAKNFDKYARAYAGSVKAMVDEPVFPKLDQINQPALIIFGKQDVLIPNRQLHPNLTTKKVAESGARKILTSSVKMIDEAGHFVHFEQADIVNKAILNFINN